MMTATTLDPMYWPLMELPTVKLPYCAVCGRSGPLEQHHIVWRSWGNMYEGGKRLHRPKLTLCGFGNNYSDADGIPYCHGRAHHRMLHFRNDRGLLEFAEFDEPTDYLTALGSGGWRPLGYP